MPRRQSSRAASRFVTAAAAVIAVAGLVLLAVVLVDPPDGSAPAGARNAGRAERTLTVNPRDCSDGRAGEEGRRAGTRWCTLSAAIRAARPGTVIDVAAGRYPQLALTGRPASAGRVTIRGAARGRTVFAGLDLKRADNLRFERLAFTKLVQITNGSAVTLAHNDLRGTGITVTVSRKITVSGNHIHDLHGEQRGIYFRGNSVPGRPDNDNVIVRDNRIERLDHDAIAFYNGYRNVLVEGNTISRVMQPPGFPLHSDGMQFMGGANLTVRHNVIRDVSKQGMFFKDGTASTNLVIDRNVIYRIAGPGLQVFSAPQARITHNTIWGTKLGSFLGDDAAVRGATSARVLDNVFDRLTPLVPSAVAVAARNVFGAGRTVGSPAYRGTPNFRDPAHGDLRIDRAQPEAGIPAGRAVPGAQHAPS